MKNMKKVLLFLLMLLSFALPAESPRRVVFFWTMDLAMILGSDPSHQGVFVLVADESEETTHYQVTVDFTDRDGGLRWLDRFVLKQASTHTPVLIETNEIAQVQRITVIAIKVTGYRSGLIGF